MREYLTTWAARIAAIFRFTIECLHEKLADFVNNPPMASLGKSFLGG